MAFTFLTQKNFTWIKNTYGLKRAHFENMKGTEWDSHVYCGKTDKSPFEFGEKPSPGKRNDLQLMCEQLLGGGDLEEIILSNTALASTFVRNHRGLRELISIRDRKRSKPAPKVYWLCGATGTGKTSSAFAIARSVFGDSQTWISSTNLEWYDNSGGKRAVIIDDLRSYTIRFNFLLRLTDKYPLEVPVKGGFTSWKPDVIFITTPHQPDITTFPKKQSLNGLEDIKQLLRRITRVFDFTDRTTLIPGVDPDPRISRNYARTVADELAEECRTHFGHLCPQAKIPWTIEYDPISDVSFMPHKEIRSPSCDTEMEGEQAREEDSFESIRASKKARTEDRICLDLTQEFPDDEYFVTDCSTFHLTRRVPEEQEEDDVSREFLQCLEISSASEEDSA
jgi:DNA polymerase III delta prime subunit